MQGTSGEQSGLQGIQGVQGQTGGAGGTQGPVGPQGLQGSGSQGVQGLQGHQGIQGGEGGFESGTQGMQGPQGVQGSGNEGIQGVQGPRGNQGVQGSASNNEGVQGPQGPQGPTGVESGGPQGIQGVQGVPGSGLQGTRGIQGIQGNNGTIANGTQGTRGYQGVQGHEGEIGPEGPIGPQGVAGGGGGGGNQGVQGPIGPQGTAGQAGGPGAQGTLGAQGPAGDNATAVEVSSIHTQSAALQSTNLFIPMVSGSAGAQPFYATKSPNPGSQENFFYTNDVDTLTLENITVEGGITLGGVTETSWPSGSGGGFDGTATNTVTTGKIVMNDNAEISFGTSSGEADMYSDGTDLMLDLTHQKLFKIRNEYTSTTTGFTFDAFNGDLTAAGDINSTSDKRLKENVETIDNALDKVLAMRGVGFNRIGKDTRSIGVIAQEIEKILPEVVHVDDSDEKFKSVSYANIVAVLIEAIKEQQEQIEDLKSKI
jgi:hypothetical protein